MAMARFRLSVEKLGYEVGPVGKHGNFEAAGFSRDQVMAFSTRRHVNGGRILCQQGGVKVCH
jgi:hypothetical protein